jgi:hypothetical protein
MTEVVYQPAIGGFGGSTFDAALDGARLGSQLVRVHDAMIGGAWRTLDEIAALTGDRGQSISARLRDLRKERFGGFVVNRQRRGDGHRGIWEYQVLKPGAVR